MTDLAQHTDHAIVPSQVVIPHKMIAMIPDFPFALLMEGACVLIQFWEMRGVLKTKGRNVKMRLKFCIYKIYLNR